MKLTIFDPFQYFREVRSFTVHENTHSKNTGHNPDHSPNGKKKYDDRNGHLTGRWRLHGDAHEHENGRKHWQERKDNGHSTVRVAHGVKDEHEAHNEKGDHGPLQLLGLLIGIVHGPDAGVQRGIEKETQNEKKDKKDQL